MNFYITHNRKIINDYTLSAEQLNIQNGDHLNIYLKLRGGSSSQSPKANKNISFLAYNARILNNEHNKAALEIKVKQKDPDIILINETCWP